MSILDKFIDNMPSPDRCEEIIDKVMHWFVAVFLVLLVGVALGYWWHFSQVKDRLRLIDEEAVTWQAPVGDVVFDAYSFVPRIVKRSGKVRK